MEKLSVEKISSKGIAIGKAYKFENSCLKPDTYLPTDINVEISNYNYAMAKVSKELNELSEKNEIFAGHLEIVNDITFISSILEKLANQNKNVQIALKEATQEVIAVFESMDSEYMKERASDIRDLYQRILATLQNVKLKNLSSISSPSIVIAKELSPSDVANMNLDYVLGFATQTGTITSHASIIARNLNLPALVGVENLLKYVNHGDILILDAYNGDIYINPDEKLLKEFENKKKEFEEREEKLRQAAHLQAVSEDGKKVLVYSNVSSIDDIRNAVKHHIDGIGLFRTEFLYMDNLHFPTENEQFKAYKSAVELCNSEVIIRTLDIGGDKKLPYYEFAKEDNPFLGFRAIRISLSMQNMFKEQLRALLRTSAFGNVSIMYPMIVSVEELLEANEILDDCKKELDLENIAYDKDIKVGMMIETPATVIEAESFAKYVDFFSIGTNDLTQYILATDRGNEKISDIYDSFNPAVLHAIQTVIDAAHKENIKVSMCGEFASDEKACKMLLGMGLDEFSVNFTQVAAIKDIIRKSNFEKCKKIAQKIKFAHTKKEIDTILDMF